VTWGTDHITKTITYTFADGTKNPVVSSVQPTKSTPTYSAGVETYTLTYGDGYKPTITANSTSAPVTWGTDHITKTITYTFADGTTNAVVSTQQPNQSGGSYSASIYPSNWSSTGVVVTKPVTSPIKFTYGDGFVNTQSGTVSSPFDENLLAAKTITDPNAVIKTPTNITYNLTWGTPDKNGPSYATAFNQGNSSYSFPSPLNIWGNTVTGYNLSSGPTFSAPHPDVIAAWNNGWTGKDVNVVIADYLLEDHGVIVTSIIKRYAYGSNLYGIPLDSNLYASSLNNVFNITGSYANLSSTNAGVINLSFGANYTAGVSDAQRNVVDNNFAVLRNNWVNILSGSSGYVYNGLNLTDAVITKAAGNNSITADQESFVKAYSDIPSIDKRLLVVGALNYDSNGKGVIASYSNTAGSYSNVSSRFLLASGGTPYTYGDIARNGYLMPASPQGEVGTSFAAPRVAGDVAIVRQKFPNLSGANTADIMLQTARYDTLSCYPNCDPAIYGKGEASLSRALAPVGRLR
jgi:hypothetical protein